MNKREENIPVNTAQTLARFVTEFDLNSVPPEVIKRAKLCLLDAFGIGLASVNFEFAQKTAAGIHSIAGDGEFPVIGMPLKLPQRDAAHLNGTLIHGLDFDDTHGEAVVHTSASATPTMLIAGLANGASGAEASSRSPSIVTMRLTTASLREGKVMTASPRRTVPDAMVPLKPRKLRSGRLTYCTGKRKSMRLRSDAICTFSRI